jgi:hypothetical protein
MPLVPVVRCRYKKAMRRWEYMTFDIKNPSRNAAAGLARLGADGVGVVSRTAGAIELTTTQAGRRTLQHFASRTVSPIRL